eukprot:1097648-Amphidinium_carterae.1
MLRLVAAGRLASYRLMLRPWQTPFARIVPHLPGFMIGIITLNGRAILPASVWCHRSRPVVASEATTW